MWRSEINTNRSNKKKTKKKKKKKKKPRKTFEKSNFFYNSG